MMEQSRGNGSQGPRLSHQQPSNRERTSHPYPRGPRQEEPDHRRYDDRSRSRDTRRSHSRGSPSHRDRSNRSRSRDLTRSRPREEQEGKKRKRDENRASRWDEISPEERASKAFWTKRDTEEQRRKIQNEWDRVRQVPSDEQVAIIIADAEAAEERLRQRKLAQTTEEDEKVARSLFWTEQEAANKEIIKKHEHATRVFKEDQDKADARAKEEKQRRECAARSIQEDEDKRARQQKKQHGGRYDTIPQVSLTAMTIHRGLDFSGSRTMLVQRLMEDDIRREQGKPQEETEDQLMENQCPICYEETEENSRVHMYMCCEKWNCIQCSIRWIEEPRCMLCNVNKSQRQQDRPAEGSTQW
jgi:hypothetical protein